MRKIFVIILLLTIFNSSSFSQNVGIGTIAPHQSAALEIVDSSKGILIPRMTMYQRLSILNPAEGLLVYQTDSIKGYWSFNGQLWKHKLDLNGNTQGDMLYWNGSNWVTVPAGQHGQGLFFCNGIPSWGGCAPLVTTTPIYDTTTSSAVSGGNITNDGGSTIISRGVVWDSQPNPTIMLSTKTIDGADTGNFVSNITSLIFNTTYYVRAYGTNSNGTSYGNQVIFKTKPLVLPTLTTNPIFETTFNSAKSGGNITDDGGSSIISRGIVFDTLPNPTINFTTNTNEGTGIGNFMSTLSNLSPNTTYYVRAFATNSKGTSYGNEITFTTNSLLIGQEYAGGIIFYLDSTGQHGLVCAPTDQGRYPWGCYGTSMGTVIGSGNSNTALIILGCGETNIAAKICDDLILNGYSDWYLPDFGELIKMYQQLKVNDIGNFANYYYWSSSESSVIPTLSGMSIHFGNSNGETVNKSFSGVYVRAVRAF
jgi:hypothetical protein